MTDEAQQLEAVETEETPEVTEAPVDVTDRRAALAAAFDRPRDEQGRFASKEEKDWPEEVKDDQPAEPVEEQPPQITDEDLQKLGLRKEEFDHFRTPAAYEAAKRRLEEATKGYEKLQTDAQFGGSMRNALQPYMATIQSMGVEPTVAIQHLLAADHALRYGNPGQKRQLLNRLAQSYGVPLEGMEQGEERDPYISRLEQELHELRTQTQQLMTGMQTQSMSAVTSEIEAFAQSHEHFDAVREQMAALLDAGLAENLDEAYNKALRIHPEISAQIDAQQREEAEKKRREEATRKAQAAKQAAVSVRGAPVADRPAPSPQDRRAQIAAAFDAR